jgi:uncharacterized membrane protein YciS (DUF1049 family)
MIIVGFVVFAAAIVIAAALIVQNRAMVTVHAFNQSWNVHLRWLLVAGLALTAIGLLGLGMMRLGSARYLRVSRQRRALAAENKRLAKRAAAADSAPRIGSVAHPGEPVAAAGASQRRGSASDWQPRDTAWPGAEHGGWKECAEPAPAHHAGHAAHKCPAR